jgi:hypothetical protein
MIIKRLVRRQDLPEFLRSIVYEWEILFGYLEMSESVRLGSTGFEKFSQWSIDEMQTFGFSCCNGP